MPYRIELSAEAEADLRALPRTQEVTARRAVERFLAHEPAAPSNARRPMAPNPLGAPWHLRLGALRVYYDIEEAAAVVRVVRVGVKPGNVLYLRGRPFEMRTP